MIFIWGSRLYGRCDEVRGMFHVATRFQHLWYIPLIPTGSVVVASKAGKSYRGIKVPLSLKSVLIARLRGLLVLAGVAAGGAAYVTLTERRPDTVVGVGLIAFALCVVVLFGATYIMPRVGRAHYDRAVALAEQLRMSEEGLVMLELKFKRITARQANETLASLRETGEQIKAEQERMIPGAGEG